MPTHDVTLRVTVPDDYLPISEWDWASLLDLSDKKDVTVLDCRPADAAGLRTYADLAWTVDDVVTVGKFDSDEAAEEWLYANQKHIRDRLCELGWGVIETLLQTDGIAIRGPDDEEE
jgi:hypothetical protein